MISFAQLNPFTTTAFFLYTVLIPVLLQAPALLMLSVTAGVIYTLFLREKASPRLHLLCAFLLILSTVLNGMTVHRGEDVLLVINDKPVTVQALMFGFCTGLTVISSLYHLSYFSEITTGDKLLYLTSFLSSKASMILTMAFRFIPRFIQKAREIDVALRASGQRNTENVISSVRYYIKVLSALMTWALENGITTAESMECRGYGAFRRNPYHIFRFTFADSFVLIWNSICFAVCIFMILSQRITYSFYPTCDLHGSAADVLLTYVAYALLILTPIFIKITETVKWKYYERRI